MTRLLRSFITFFLTGLLVAGLQTVGFAQKVSPGPALDYYVDAANGNDSNNGLTWGTAFETLGKALDLANANSANEIVIHVAEGIYKPTSFSNLHSSSPEADVPKGPRDWTFLINRNFVKLYGGYPAGGGARNIVQHPTILSGDIGTENDDSDNCYHVMIIAPIVMEYVTSGKLWTDANTVIEGFTLTKGNADAMGYTGSTSAYVRDARNMAIWRDRGGALFISGRNNSATNSPVFRNCIFKDNKSTLGGGAVNVEGWTNTIQPAFINCVFENNSTTGNGGAILANSRDGTRSINSKYMLRNSLFISNTATGEGGAVFNKNHDTFIINSTFYNNTAGTIGGAISNNDCWRQNYFNTLFWGNTANSNPSDISNVAVKTEFLMKNSLVQTASFAGTNGNIQITSNPFRDTGSPAGTDGKWMTVDDGLVPKAAFAGIDIADETDYSMVPDGAGDELYNGPWYGVDAGSVASDLDLAGNSRKYGAGLDVGAYEYSGTLPVNLITFTAKAENNAVAFIWKTAAETDNHHFEVERSADGKKFISVAVIPARGAGVYSAADKNPLPGMNYYQLVQYDQDGTRHNLAIEPVNFTLAQSNVKIYPNPSSGNFTVSLGAYQGKAELTLSDLSGKVIHADKRTAGSGQQVQLQVANQTGPGIYLLHINGEQLNETHKVIIE